ncbi:MAG: hypothetical protein AAGI53_00300 [Planctomycetota bacterium]
MTSSNIDRQLDGWAEDAVARREVDARGFLKATGRRRSQVIRRRLAVVGGVTLVAIVVGVALRAPPSPDRAQEVAVPFIPSAGLPTLAALKAMNARPGRLEDPVLPRFRGVSWVRGVSALP